MTSNMPGFVADASLYTSSNSYVSAGGLAGAAVTPAGFWDTLKDIGSAVGGVASQVGSALTGCPPGDIGCMAAKGLQTGAKLLL